MAVRIATFNCENLFARYRFNENFNPRESDGFTINDLAFDIYDETDKQITAQAIKEVNADVIGLQEVENLTTLERFWSRYLAEIKYPYKILIDCHDPRNIDVALLSRFPILAIRTHRHEKHEKNSKNTGFLFTRDCLEVDLDVNGKVLTIYVNHFKSMIPKREETKNKREEQASRVAQIINSTSNKNFIVLGDLNDYPDENTALGALLNHPKLVNVIERLPEDDRWTHFFAKKEEYKQLDYLFLSKELAEKNKNKPAIMRKGLPFRAEKCQDRRFPNVGENSPKASDHAPFYMDINLV